MTRRTTHSSWQTIRSRRHAAFAFSLGNLMPPTPTPVPDDDDEFDWPGAQDVEGNPISSDSAFLYAIAEANNCYSLLLGQKDEAAFKKLVTRPTDPNVTQVVGRLYKVGADTPTLTWCVNPLASGTSGQRKYGQYIIDHVLYAMVGSAEAQILLKDTTVHTRGLNKDPAFFRLLDFAPPTVPPALGAHVATAEGVVVAKTELPGGEKITWKSVKVAIIGASGHGTDGTPRHFGENQLATLMGSGAATETYAFGHPGKIAAKEQHGNALRGAFLLGYGLYVVNTGQHAGSEFYAVTPPVACTLPMQAGDPKAP